VGSVRRMDATTFAALGEPSRLQIVELLRVRPFSVGGVAETLGIRQPQVSKHLGVLREAGVVAVEPFGRRRIYRLRAEPFEEIGDWVDSFEGLWETRLDSLETLLNSMAVAREDDRP
jgi:DNA-binding transcriptional ArsR family regulator